MPDPAVHLIVFSKDRPLQLHGMLTSVFRHWMGAFTVSVLVHETDPCAQAYYDLQREFRGRATFGFENDFGVNLLASLERCDAPFFCFGCDDVVYTLPVDVRVVAAAFRDDSGLLGVSLRLGRHIRADMFGRELAQPAFAVPSGGVRTFEEYTPDLGAPDLAWDAAAGAGDWGYPWEVLGTVYPTDYVRATVDAQVRDGQVRNPSTLENAGWLHWWEHAGGRSRMQAFAQARLVVPTVNVVQSVFGNGIVGPGGMDPAFLLDCWNRGLRLDVDRYRGMAPPSWRVGDVFLRRDG
jgi:hypothetical protein